MASGVRNRHSPYTSHDTSHALHAQAMQIWQFGDGNGIAG